MDYLNITVIKQGTDEDFVKSCEENTFIQYRHEKVRIRNVINNHYCIKLSPLFRIAEKRKRPNVLIVTEDAKCKLQSNTYREFEHELMQMNPMLNIAVIGDRLILRGFNIPHTEINIKTGEVVC